MRLYKSMAARLAVDSRLHGQTFKVLMYLISVADSSNHIPGPTVVAKAMKLRQPVISRAYSELRKADVLYKKDGQYLLSPYVCWQGNQEQWNDAVRALTPGYTLTAITE